MMITNTISCFATIFEALSSIISHIIRKNENEGFLNTVIFFFAIEWNDQILTQNGYSTWPGQWTNGLWRLWQNRSLANSRRFSREDSFFSLLTLFLVFPPSSILYSPISFYSLIFLFCFLEIIAEARKGRIHILDPTETDPGGARSRDPYPDSSCKITRVRALERRRVYSRKIALACTSQGTSMCIRCTYYIYSYTSTIYLGKQGELHEISLLTEYCVLVTPYDFNCNQIFR